MRKLVLAFAFLIGAALPAAAQGCGPSNPNCIVPTAPAGTSDNRAASTAFVQSAVPAGANPTATAGPAVINGTATTFMRSDAAPPVQKATLSLFGIVEPDGSGICISGGVISLCSPYPVGANPTASVGLSGVNGVATTFMRSDGAPPLSQAIVPTWTGIHTFSNDAYFGSGRPWCDPRGKGATATAGSTNTDDTAAFTACQTAMPNGGTIYVPNGAYCLTSGFVITVPGIYLVGESNASVSLDACGADVSVISAAAKHVVIMNLQILGKGAPSDPADTTFAATQPAILANSCNGCRLGDILVYGGNHNIQSNSILEMDYVVGGYAYGDLMELSGGGFINDSSANEIWPVTSPTVLSTASIAAYQTSHAYLLGAVVTLSGYYIQATVAGTSGGSAPSLKNYTTNITDNTVTWKIVSKTGSVAWSFAGANTEYYSKFIDSTGGVEDGISIANSAAFKCFACLASQTINAPVAVSGGALIQFTNLTTGSPIITQTAGVILTNAFAGNVQITGGNIQGDYGVIVNGGNLTMVGARVLATNKDGVLLANSMVDTIVVGNHFIVGGNCATFGTGNNFTVFTNNNCDGAAFSGTAGTSSSVYANDGSGFYSPGQFPGTTTNDSATAGNVGEIISSTVTSGSAISLTTATPVNMTSISLTAGDWDVWCDLSFNGGGTTVVNYLSGSINTVTGTISQAPSQFVQTTPQTTSFAQGFGIVVIKAGPYRASLSGATIHYCVAQGGFGTSTMAVFGILRARRAR
jgi:hypothetical protein